MAGGGVLYGVVAMLRVVPKASHRLGTCPSRVALE